MDASLCHQDGVDTLPGSPQSAEAAAEEEAAADDAAAALAAEAGPT